MGGNGNARESAAVGSMGGMGLRRILDRFRHPVRTADPRKTVILFFNDIWGRSPDFPENGIPEMCEITMDRARLREADAVVFHLPSLGRWGRVKKFPGQLWVAWSMECDLHYPRFQTPRFLSRFDLTMTYRQDAHVVAPYYNFHLMEPLRTPPKPKRRDRLAAMFISSRWDKSGRLAYARELMRHMELHSYGKQLQNRHLPGDTGRAAKLDTIAGYKFTLAFENACAPDYVTEKFFDPLIAGSVPVYLGAPNVSEFAPSDRCYVDASRFETPKALAEYLRFLDEDEAAYQAYLAWRGEPFRPPFLDLMEAQRVHPFIRLCRIVREFANGQNTPGGVSN